MDDDIVRYLQKYKKTYWRVDPAWRNFCNCITQSEAHIIACARGKAQYVVDGEKGKQTVRKMGVGADMRDGFDYEFTISFNIDQTSHTAQVDKDNTHIFDGRNIDTILTEKDGISIIEWANSGSGKNMSEIKKETEMESDVQDDAPSGMALESNGSLSEYIAQIKNAVDEIVENASDEDKKELRSIVASTIKKYVKNDAGKAVADYRLIKDINVAKTVLVALNNIPTTYNITGGNE